MKRVFLTLIFLAVILPLDVFAGKISPDSLRKKLAKCTSPRERIDVLLNLKDLTENEPGYPQVAFTLYQEAKQAKDPLGIASSLSSIAAHYIDANRSDSLFHYLNDAGKLLEGSSAEGLADYYTMVYNARKLQGTDRANREHICDSLIRILDLKQPDETKYMQAARLFLRGVITYQLMSVSGNPDISSGLPYWEEEWRLIQDFPATTRRNFAANAITCLLPSYIQGQNKTALDKVSAGYFEILDAYFSDPEILERRPHINKEPSYMICYHSLINAHKEIGREKAHEYYLRYRRFILSNQASLINDKNFYYTLSGEHYRNRGDYETALKYNDSMMILKNKGASLITSHTLLYKSRAGLLKRLNRYEEACSAYEAYIKENDSLIQKTYVEKLSEMRVVHEVDKLELERANILSEKHRSNLYLSLCICVLILLVAAYLFFSLQKERKLKKELEEQREIARESERFKNEFIKSISHEIRTPLNAICGFSGLIASEQELPADEKEKYAQFINANTLALTSLVDCMLEVSALDSATRQLPVQTADLASIGSALLQRAAEGNPNKAVRYRFKSEQGSYLLETNESYLTKVISELLGNAAKFTEEGEIELAIRKEKGQLVVSITDTGCGISPENHKKVFNRFFKVDSFSQGNGLGLSLCEMILQKLGGEIRIDESYTGGTRIIITFPETDCIKK